MIRRNLNYIILGIIIFLIKSALEIAVLKGFLQAPESIPFFIFEIRFYSLFMLLGIGVLIFFVERFKTRDKELKKIEVDEVIIYAAVPAIIGARLWHVVTDWQLYESNAKEALYIWNGGLGIYGAVLGVMLGVFAYSKMKKKNFLKILNLAALFLPLAQIIGRYGNFFNQELFGRPTNLFWGMYIRSENRPLEFIDKEYFHPSYLYEQLGNFILLCINFLLYKKFGLKNNMYLATWLVGYGITRFIVEFFRIDDKYYSGLSINQIASIPVIICGIIYLIVVIKKSWQNEKKEN